MRRIISFMLIFVIAISLQAQNEYRVGDRLHTQQVSYVSFDQMEGQGLVWNMNGCKVVDGNYSVRYVTNRDTLFHAGISRLELGTNYRYDIYNDTLFLKGFKNKSARIKYDFPIAILRFPILYRDVMSGLYRGNGTDELEHKVEILVLPLFSLVSSRNRQ